MAITSAMRLIAWVPFGLAFARIAEVFYFRDNIITAVLTSAIALVCVCVVFVPALFGGRLPLQKLPTLFIVTLFCLSGLSMLTQFALDVERIDKNGVSSLIFLRTRWIEMFSWLGLGVVASHAQIKRSGWLAALVVLGAPLLVYFLATEEFGGGNYLVLAEETNFIGLSHLAIADHALLLVYLAYATAPARFRPLIMAVGALTLYPLGGRASFYIGIGALLAYHLLAGPAVNAGRWLAITGVAVVGVLLSMGVGVLGVSDEFLVRMNFDGGLTEDLSFADRYESLVFGASLLALQFWYGGSGALVESFGFVGSYMHNIMSAWQFFGAPFFLLLLCVWLLAIRRARAAFGERAAEPLSELMVLLVVYSVLSLILSRSSTFWLAWFSLGLALSWVPESRRYGSKWGAFARAIPDSRGGRRM
jgi:hypothetical protein